MNSETVTITIPAAVDYCVLWTSLRRQIAAARRFTVRTQEGSTVQSCLLRVEAVMDAMHKAAENGIPDKGE